MAELANNLQSTLNSQSTIVISAAPNPGQPPTSQGSKLWDLGSLITDSGGMDTFRDYFINEGTVGSYKLYICDTQGIEAQRDIFTEPNSGYKIEIEFSVLEFPDLVGNPTTDGFVTIEFGCGYKTPITKKYKVSDFDDIQKEKFFYQVSDFGRNLSNAKNFWLRKVGAGVLKVINSKVTYGTYVYDDSLNNKLYDFFGSGNTIPVKSNTKNIQLDLGQSTGLKFGNGRFKKGVWKSGVWNNGYRGVWPGSSNHIYYFDSVNLGTFQLSKNTWYLKLNSNVNFDNFSNILVNLQQNDYIAVSNVVGIDINDERYLLKDYYRITDIVIDVQNQSVVITLEIPIAKFPLRRFELDSENHLIYVTKNIWLGGTFLNGYFNGIWNYGLFKGFPYTTIMEDSHFIDGKLDGGRFVSKILSITNSTSDAKQYQSGLVQFMEFYDNNVSEKESTGGLFDNTYQTWMDVNYYTQSFVNLNSLTTIYDQNFGKVVPLPNLYGYPTRDILSSRSKFKNTSDREFDFYNLGTKYKIFTDHLEERGYFTKPFNSEGRPGLDNFIDKGWTANTGNFYNTPTVSFAYNSNITRRNFNRFTIVMATFGYNILNNDTIQVEDKRYILVEYDLEYFTRGYDRLTGKFTNSFQRPLSLLGSNYSPINNIYRSGVVKTEYFYNKNALDLVLRYNSELEIPTNLTLAMYGYNVNHGQIPPTGESYTYSSTTWSMIAPSVDTLYRGTTDSNGLSVLPSITLEWEDPALTGTSYDLGDIVRDTEPGSDSLGYFYISLTSSNVAPPREGPFWARTMVGFNDLNFENTILEQSDIFAFFTSLRISYFKFLEIDALPFFKYYDYEVNFVDTYRDDVYVGLEFTKPHGFKIGDLIRIKLDETKFNPQYENFTASVLSVVDGKSENLDVVYTLKTNIPWGLTVSYLGESGTVFRTDGKIRIDNRIQTNYSAVSPKVADLNEEFVYLSNNQIYIDRANF